MAFRVRLPRIPIVAPVSHRGVISVSGSDATEFLNGLLSSNVRPPSEAPFPSAVLNAQGRVFYDIFVYPNPTLNGYLIEHDSRNSGITRLLPHLKKYVLRKKVLVKDVSDNYDIWASWGEHNMQNAPPRSWKWAASDAVEPVWQVASPWYIKRNVPALRDIRAPGMGIRSLVEKGHIPEEAKDHELRSSIEYDLHRIVNGVPEGILDLIPGEAFPMESNLDLTGAVDVRKGCYVGQELTSRTYHTGMIRKRILPVSLHPPGERPQGDFIPSSASPYVDSGHDIKPVVVPGREAPRPRGTGTLLGNRYGVGLALLRLEQVAKVLSGELLFRIEGDGKPTSDDRNVELEATPWYPDWWPERTIDPD